MKKIITICLIALGFSTYAQNTQFQRVIGGSKGENAYSLDRSREGGYYLAGYTNSIGSGNSDAYVVKTDGLGQIIWAKSYGESKDDAAWKVRTTSDSGCVIVGTTSSFNSGNADGFITKLTKTGAISWTTTLATDSVEDIYNVSIARNGDYLVCGFVRNDTNSDDMLVARISTAGAVKWLRKIGSKGNDEGYSIAEDLKGNILVCGTTSYDSVTVGGRGGNPGDKDFVVASLNDKGGLNWMKTYGTFDKEEAWDIQVDGNKYLVTGWGSAGGPDNEIHVMMLDTNGTSQWHNTYGTFGDDRAFGLEVLANSNYLVTGYSDPNGTDRDVAVLLINSAGRLTSSQLVGSTGKDGHWPTDVIRSSDGGVTILSTTNSYSSSTGDNFYLIRGTDDATFNCNSRLELFQETSGSFSSIKLTQSTQGHKSVSRTFKSTNDNPKVDTTLCCKLSAEVIGSAISICRGDKRAIGGPKIEGYIYSWTDDVAGYTSSEANPQVSPSKTATFKLVVSSKDKTCASDSATVKITVKDVLTDDFVKDTFFCSGDSIKMKIRSDLASYSWNGKHLTSTDSNVTVKKGDTLYVALFDNKGCGYLDTAIVEEKALPVINLGNDTTICDNLPITLSGPTGMKSYDWNSGESSAQTFTTKTEKTHKLVVVDTFGCTSTDQIRILTNPHSTFSLGNDTAFCEGSKLTILGPGALTGYIWNDTASSSQNLRVDKAGTYHLTAFNSFGCPYSDTIKVTVLAAPVFSLGSDFILCAGTSKEISGPAGMTTYLWSSGKNTMIDTIKKEGLHFLIVSDANGCQASDTIEAFERPNPIPDLGNDTTICDTSEVTLQTARNYVAYSWSTGATTKQITVSDKGTYTVTVTDTNGCMGSGSIDVDTVHCGTGSILKILSGEFKVFPNPSNGSFTFEVRNYREGNELTVSVFDMRGKTVAQRNYAASESISDRWDISSFGSGVYLIRISNSTGVKQVRLLVE